MKRRGLKVNLVLGGGGVKGVAYAGVCDSGERMGFRWGNIAGVSSGALAGAYIAAGYNSKELLKILSDYNFSELSIDSIAKVPVVARFNDYSKDSLHRGENSVKGFLNNDSDINDLINENSNKYMTDGRGIFKNIIKYSKEGCLYDGDKLEEWVYKILLRRGIKTFEDLRGGVSDQTNPRGYKIRMTAVDATQKKIVVLPDDLAFYGINPDKTEVAHAVRMSVSVPFAFKPVDVKYLEDGKIKSFQFVDGGVIDNFPFWLISDTKRVPTAGFRLSSEKKKLMSLDTPLNIYKSLISASHDIGIPKKDNSLEFSAVINTEKVKFLDFDFNDKDREYLYNAGKKSAMFVFEAIRRKYEPRTFNIFNTLYRLITGR